MKWTRYQISTLSEFVWGGGVKHKSDGETNKKPDCKRTMYYKLLGFYSLPYTVPNPCKKTNVQSEF